MQTSRPHAASAGAWRVAAATSVGAAHLARGLECQDACCCATLQAKDGSDVLFAAVSDGAGTARCAAEGARLACGTLQASVERYLDFGRKLSDLDIPTVRGWIDAVRMGIAEAASLSGAQPSDYACTLLAAVVQGRHLATLQIGDGAIVYAVGGQWRWAYWPMHGEHANSTFFITSEDAHAVAAFDLNEIDVDEVALFTDGLEWMLLHRESKSVHAPFFDQMMPAVRGAAPGVDASLSQSLATYLGSAVVNDRTSDDKTLVLASRARARS